MQKLITLSLVLGIAIGLSAQQKSKLGHINSQELVQLMPEFDSAQLKLERITKEYEKSLEEMNVELNTKYDKLMQEQSTMSELVKNTKMSELESLQQKIQQFQVNAQKDLQQKNAEFMAPIREKAIKAIEDVASENGFTYIFDQAAIIYAAEGTEDILPLVKKKLGIE